jgi:short-subunit dehydrogenase
MTIEKNSRPNTVVITGASSGIGKAFAIQLASMGYNILLVARREERLAALKTELQQKYTCTCEILALDLSDPINIEILAEKIRNLPALHFLINNAGFGIQGDFVANNPQRETEMIHLHVLATNQLCQAALPIMMQQKSGVIINVASVAGLMLTPHHINYDATKGYVILFSKVLAEEYGPYGIRVQALCPGYTRTEFHQQNDFSTFDTTKMPSLLWMTPETVVEKSLAALKHKRVVFIPGLLNQLMTWIFTQPLFRAIIVPVYRRMVK